jgi:hypothetical protein
MGKFREVSNKEMHFRIFRHTEQKSTLELSGLEATIFRQTIKSI